MEITNSKVDGNPTHIIMRAQSVRQGRTNLMDDSQPLQAAIIAEASGKDYPAHKHLPIHRELDGPTQEAWVVIKGAVIVFLHDIDDSQLLRTILWPGDCLITIRGGHHYIISDDGTIVYEFKNGDYRGKDADKVEI